VFLYDVTKGPSEQLTGLRVLTVTSSCERTLLFSAWDPERVASRPTTSS